MFQFLSPPALLALFALVAPIAIHLLSRKPGKTVKVGSLKFLETAESRQLRSLKLTDIPLLLFRCALLAVLALLLAKPFWQSSTPSGETKARGWVLMAPEFIAQPHDIKFDQLLDSLVTAGNELHILAPDFAAVKMAAGKIVHPEAITTYDPPNYWSLLREIDRQIPRDMPLWILVPDRLSFFHGARPTLKRAVHWFDVPGRRENRWIQQVQAIKNDRMRLGLGFSDSRQTKFAHSDLRFPNQQLALSGSGLPALAINPQSNSLSLLEKDSYAGDDFFTLSDFVDSTMVIIWHDNKHNDDARYVHTALETAGEFGRLPIIIKSYVIAANNEIAQNADWAFWLTEQPLPKILLQQIAQGLCLISDAGSQEYESVESFITVKTQQTEHIAKLLRRVAAKQNSLALWTDGFGERVLEAEAHGKGWHYRFHSRFRPAWNELVLSAAFPEWLLDLLNQHSKINRNSDQRRVSAGQSQPQTQISTATTLAIARTASLHFPFWIFAVILFVAERWFAATTKGS
jgi:hypothetical protein